jgi:hypothetical protein
MQNMHSPDFHSHLNNQKVANNVSF